MSRSAHHVKWWDSLQGARPAVTIDCALNRWATPIHRLS